MDSPELVYGVMLAQFITSACLLGVGLVVCFSAVRIVRVPTNVLIPLIAVFSIAGTYAVKLLMFDVVLMLLFAALCWARSWMRSCYALIKPTAASTCRSS